MELDTIRVVAKQPKAEYKSPSTDDITRQLRAGSFSCFVAATRGDECGHLGCLWRDKCPAAYTGSCPKE